MLKTYRMKPGDENEYLFLKVDRKFVKIMISEILYIESLKDYIRVTTKSSSFISYQSLTSITEKLPPENLYVFIVPLL